MQILVLLLVPVIAFLCALPFLYLGLSIATLRSRLRTRRDLQADGGSNVLHACVVSLSPASRSPRVVNHALSFARSGKFSASIHAYAPCPEFDSSLELSFVPVEPTPQTSRTSLVRTVIFQARALFQSLVTCPGSKRYDVMVVNSPPCIPTFAVVLLASRVFHSCPVLVDWHNFAYTIMQTTGKSPFVIAVARVMEWYLGRQMDGHFCVSGAMRDHLAAEWAIDAHVLYDRPRDHFRLIPSAEEQHEVFAMLHKCIEMPLGIDGGTMATVRDNSGILQRRKDGPAIVVSSTSWTPDEDFSILLDALIDLDARLATLSFHPSCPFGGRVVCIITGKGPMRAEFEAKYRAAALQFVQIYFAWLPREEYPRLLGCAHLGVSLHTSSSGLDLPMKIVDMLGCGLPVLSYKYECIEELIKPGKTGLLFADAATLAQKLDEILFQPDAVARRTSIAKHIDTTFSSPAMRWQDTWECDALPVIAKTLEGKGS